MEPFRGKSNAGAYGDFLIETDWHVGRILELLDSEQIANDTIVIFSSDNGPENTWKARAKKFAHQSNGIYREGKRSIYEGGHRVPMFIRWPAKIPPASFCDGPVCQTDLMATFAEMLGTELPDSAGEDSISIFSVLLNPGAIIDRAPIIHHSSNGRFAIRSKDWKLVMNSKTVDQRELYDVKSDPGETANVIDDHDTVAIRLTNQLTRIVDQGRSTPGKPQVNDTPWWDDLVWMKP